MSLSTAQRGVVAGASQAMLLSLAVLGAAVASGALPAAPDTPAARVQLLAACSLAPLLALAACIAALAQHRFRTPADIDGSGLTAGTDRAKVLQALLQNTLEQLALALPAYAAWAALAPSHMVRALPGAALLFVAGRLLFARGYASGAAGRAMGFGLTFYPSILLLAGNVVFVIARVVP
ncbi:MAPEG family protein [Cognatilysobacter lacus]|uniref:MAPEG family protein n=1 Tax=Cognatilysobacter lacus TaxID=1643323 RepID=A0A5D8Z7V3_9GAMM|nr:MAPEG family protein [Lysobacter lacus]TZF90881.1 MAPEG family protein [Lysobacter lacus]